MNAQPQRPLNGLTILVVDDHRDTVDMLREYLDMAGATVVGADGAKAALAFAQMHTLDAALVDIRMPGEDGHWFLRNMRASRALGVAQVPIFAISGNPDDTPPADSGFAGHFLKPVDLEVLVAMLAPLPRRRS
jgi:CheY-like chemotaxis protein